MVIVVCVLVLHQMTELTGGMERRFYDMASTSSPRTPSDRIAIIAIDDQSIGNLGRWPWPRDIQARLIDLLAAANAKVIANTVFYFEPQTDRGLTYIHKIRDLLGSAADASAISMPMQEELGKLIAEAQAALDTDTKLAASIAKAGNVLLPSVFALGEPQGRADKPLPDFALKSSLEDRSGFSVSAVSGQQPLASIGGAALGIGHFNQWQDVDGAVRSEPLLVNYYGRAIPSMALMTVLKSLNLDVADIRIDSGQSSLQLGKLRVATDGSAFMLPQFYKPRDGKPAFPVDSFYDVLTGKIPASKYAGKIVIIGPTAAGVGAQFAVPGSPSLSPAETTAHIVSSILGEHFIVQPDWGVWASLAALLLVAAYLVAGLPRLSAGTAAITTVLLLTLLLGTEFGLLAGAATWLKLVLPASVLVLGHLGLTTKRYLTTEAGKLKSDEESAETNRMMALAYQGQGQLDAAFDRFLRVPVNDAVMDNLNSLAMDFERKRQFNKAQAVYEHMAAHNPGYKDLPARIKRVKNLSETVMLGGATHAAGTMLLEDGAVEKPMLGRYQIEKELGKGAMGVVYLGKDPKIGRIVAIKTLALGQEFEGEALQDARERFFREAETAGRLQHQNIVTIFDAGEEHDLAYIAMEFLKGEDLTRHCRPGQLLTVPQVISIVARVAEALAYAHRQSVVHRDIKPANIMFDLATDTVKVTDFGIARITDSSKTKTGMVLGTPSFMSPEQIAGRKVDGRSDLYSLGVMCFQLLAGALPFRGESMTELMYKIANETAPDLRTLRPELSGRLADVVAQALQKQLALRYQDGSQFAADLRSAGALAAATAEPAAVPPNGPDLPDNVPDMNPQPFATTIVSPAPGLMVNEPTEVLARPSGSA